MCGICGFVGAGDTALLHQMTDLIVHRGPDEEGYFVEAPAALGMRRLSIIDLDASQQPIFNEDEQITIVFNGEIYNYQNLRQKLIEAGHTFRTHGDTETIIHAYEEYGVECLQYLDGMFAFAIWDKRKQQLFIARDRLGIKPLFYCTSANTFIFGSEIRCLLQHPAVQAQPNLRTIFRYFTFGFTTERETAFEGIYQLTPGDYLLWDQATGLRVQAYWRPEFQPEVRKLNLEAAAEELAARFSRSVKDHLVSDVPVGITLSGGLDSSSVLSQMVKHYEGQVDAFTIGYGREDDEFPFAKLGAQHFGVNHHCREISFAQTARNLARMVYHLEEPLPHVVASTTYELGRMVHGKVKVILIGEGGDELLAGYVQYRTMARRFRFLPLFVRQRSFLLGYLSEAQFHLPRLFSDSTKRALAGFHPVRDEYLPHYRNKPDALTGAQYFEIRNELPNNQLSRIDRLTMAHSIEARVPFLDHNFVNFCFSLHPDHKLHGFLEKYVLRRAMAAELPADLVNRRKGGKKGTQAITQSWYDEQLQHLTAHYLSANHLKQRGIFTTQGVAQTLERTQSPNGVTRRVALKQAYTLLMVELWMRLFIDRQSPETLENEITGILG